MTKQQQTEYQYAKENAAKWCAMAERNEHPGRSFCLTQVGNWEAKANRIAAAPDLEANARLIAAAPDLLAALADMRSGWQYIREQHGDLYGVGWDRCEQSADAAIAAATGAGE